MQNQRLREEDQWVGKLFQTVLDFIKALELTRESPSIFLVYAHDSETEIAADAEVAQQVIQWLTNLGAHLYSDRSPGGNYHLEPRTSEFNPERAQNILSSQLCLLPNASLVSDHTVDRVILCGSELLGHYLESEYYQRLYAPQIQSAYDTMQAESRDRFSRLANYINTQVEEKQQGFHHVLTELAFLELRAKTQPTSHGIVPFLLNGQHATSFPTWVKDSTMIRIEDAVYRAPSDWKGKPTYQNQGLHVAFFKLLKRLWPKKEEAIYMIEEKIYKTGLQSVQEGKNSVYQTEQAIQEVMESFRQEKIVRWRSETMETYLRSIVEILKSGPERTSNDSKLEITKQLNAWYPSLADASVTGRLAIQRISGEPLPLEHCYINLGVIEYQPKQNQDMEDKASNRRFYRLRNAEAVTNTQTSDPIALADLFKPRPLKNGVEGIPKRILIRGRAGIGKTTLAKKSVYDHIHHQHWAEQFDYVLWIRLRDLKGKPKNYSLKTLLYEEYFEGYSNNGHDLAELLYEHIQKDRHKTLFILDGWDEITQEPPTDCLHTLVKHPAVMITSRPHGVSVKTFEPIELELETIGFSEANVMAYLDHPKIVDPNAATAIKAFIQQHFYIRELVNIPIQLDALCYSWELIQDDRERVQTMTGLYQVMTEQLWRKDIVRLGKKEHDRLITKERAQSMLRFDALVEEEGAYLEALAFNGLYSNQIEFYQTDLLNIAQHLDQERHQRLPIDLPGSVAQLSCLQVEKEKRSTRLHSCQFLHLTFQEFFAAQSLAKAFTQRKSLAVLKGPPIKADEFIRQYKYDPRYEIVWWLLAGLLERDALIQFFGLLDEDPQDLIGIQHQYLVMHCLRESRDTLPKDQQESRLSHLSSWLHVEILHVQIMPDLNQASPYSYLGRQEALPEVLLVGLLMRGDATARLKKTVANTLGERHSCSHRAVHALIRLLQDTYNQVRQAAAWALAKQSRLSPEIVEALICLLQDTYAQVRQAAAWALAKQAPLAPEVVEALIPLLQDTYAQVRQAAAEALGKQSPLPPEGVKALMYLLQDSDAQVRQAAASALWHQSPLAPEGVEALIPLLQDTDAEVRWWAASALGKQSPLSPEVVETLLRLLEDTDAQVRWWAARALEQQSLLSPEVLEALIRLPQHADAGVWVVWVESKALAKQSLLAPEVVEALMRLLEDTDAQVRQAAARALEKQSPLSPTGVEALIPLLQDADAGVREAAAEVLGQQSPLVPQGVEALIPLLQNSDAWVRWAAVRALRKQSPLVPQGVEALIRLLQDADGEVREEAARALGYQSPLSPQGVEALIPLLQDADWEVRGSAASALEQQSPLDPERVQALIPLLQDTAASVRHTAARALGHQSSLAPEVVEALIPLLQDANTVMRQDSARALGYQSPLSPQGLEALIPLLQDTAASVRQTAASALRHQSPLSPEGVEALIPLLQDSHPEVDELTTQVLHDQNSWNVYRLLPTMNTSSLKAVYSQWILPHNFKQPAPLYLHSGQLHFYTPKGLETISLNDQEETFRKTILEAQQAAGIPEVSQIKIQTVSSHHLFSSTLFSHTHTPDDSYEQYSIVAKKGRLGE